MQTINIQTMAKHYLIAAVWADKPEGTNPRITKDAQAHAERICMKFAGLIAPFYADILACPGYWAHPDCDGAPEAALGHDLYLTSAGHGAGFWDRDTLPEELGAKLSALCGHGKAMPQAYPECYRGWVYLHGGV